MKISLEVRILITLARIFAFCALTLGFIYAMVYKDGTVMIATVTSACAMFALNSNGKVKKEVK